MSGRVTPVKERAPSDPVRLWITEAGRKALTQGESMAWLRQKPSTKTLSLSLSLSRRGVSTLNYPHSRMRVRSGALPNLLVTHPAMGGACLRTCPAAGQRVGLGVCVCVCLWHIANSRLAFSWRWGGSARLNCWTLSCQCAPRLQQDCHNVRAGCHANARGRDV